jgi:hypothetical protein
MNTSTPCPVTAAKNSGRSRAESLLLLTAGALLAATAWAWLAGPVSALHGTPAIADVAVAGTDHGLLASDGGGDDVLLVLDQRNEEVLLYRPVNGRTVDFRARYLLRDLFNEARASGGIAPMPEPERTPGTPPPGGSNPPR